MSQTLSLNLFAILSFLVLVWCLSIPLRNVSIVDLVWGLGFVIVASLTYLQTHNETNWKWLLPVLTTIWGVRLSGYLAWRNHGKPEDKRYAKFRSSAGERFWWQSLFTVFLLQGALIWLISLPIQLALMNPSEIQVPFLTLGLVMWTVGFAFETIGDLQLAIFKSDASNKGKLFTGGLWRYTRHPNYFGDFLVWWGLFLISFSQGAPLWTILCPLLMTILLRNVSGVSMTDKMMLESYPAYQDYIKQTNAFFPGFPRS